MATCEKHGTLRHADAWFTTSPTELIREKEEREKSRVFAPTVRRRKGKIEKIKKLSP